MLLENNLDELVVQVLCALVQIAHGEQSVNDTLQQAIKVAKCKLYFVQFSWRHLIVVGCKISGMYDHIA